MIKLGDLNIDNLFMGNNQVDRLMMGTQLVWEHITSLFPSWTTLGNNGAEFMVEWEKEFNKPYDITNLVSTHQLDNHIGEYTDIINGPDGIIYFIPHTGTVVKCYDTNTDEISTIILPQDPGSELWGVLAPNGKIYCMPTRGGNATIIAINTNDKTAYSVDNPNSRLFMAPVVGDDGHIYVTSGGDDIYKLDTTTEELTSIYPNSGMSERWLPGGDGYIYDFGYYDTPRRFHPETQTIEELTNTPPLGVIQFLVPSGHIIGLYAGLYDGSYSTIMSKYDVNTGTYTETKVLPYEEYFPGYFHRDPMFIAPNGHVYFQGGSSYEGYTTYDVDPVNETLTVTPSDKWEWPLVLTEGGYLLSIQGRTVNKYGSDDFDISEDILCSRYLTKNEFKQNFRAY